jgi:superfamily I DNA and/or RNA helicase
LRGRATELEIRIDETLFASTRVVACTLIGSASKVLERKHFPTLFIDEAAQAFEAACWAAIQKADRVIFAGDHKQLPPTIKSREAERAGLGRTLMEHVATAKPECVELLTVQYRMHRDIMAFSSQRFYGGRLKAAPEIADRTVLPMEFPLVWVDTAALGFEEEQNDLSQSRLNRAEADLLVQTLWGYVERVGIERLRTERTDFGIISPYKSQVQLLRQKNQELPRLDGTAQSDLGKYSRRISRAGARRDHDQHGARQRRGTHRILERFAPHECSDYACTNETLHSRRQHNAQSHIFL